MPPTRRRAASPAAVDLDELTQSPAAGGRLRKAPAADPVLGTGSRAPDSPAELVEARQENDAESGRRPRARSGSPSGRASRGERAAPPGAKTKVGFYADPGATARARAAYDWTRPHEGHRSFSDFIAAAVAREVARLESKYHDGQPWPALEPGQIPTGKPLGA